MTTLREMLNKHQMPTTILLIVAALILLVIIVGKFTGGAGRTSSKGLDWYYDLTDKKLFAGPTTWKPPLLNPATGNVSVRARLYTCSDCQEANRFLGYYERFVNYKETRVGERVLSSYEIEVSGDAQVWEPIASTKGQFLVQGANARCSGKIAMPCVPAPSDR